MQTFRTCFCAIGLLAELAAMYLLFCSFHVFGFAVNGVVKVARECSLVAVPCFLVAMIGGSKDWLITVGLLVLLLFIAWCLTLVLHS